jgi:LacI family transcriptional regulator
VGRGVKIAEVAATAGVGVGTVSRVINGSPHVREVTRQHVLDVISRLGYRPSRLASSLALGTTRAVAVLVPFLTRPSVAARLNGILGVLDAEGYDCIVCNVESPEQRDRSLHNFADPHRVDGILVLSLPLRRPQVEAVMATGVGLVLVDSDCVGVPRVLVDNVAGGQLATTHLLELGHRHIAFLGDITYKGMGFRSIPRRLTGYRRALAHAGIAYEPDLVWRSTHTVDAAAEVATQLLGGRDPPTAVFAATDTLATGVLVAAEALGLLVPRDLSVVGFDDIDVAAMVKLSTVRQPLQRSGEEGAEKLCRILRGLPVRAIRTVLPLELIVRSSTAAPHVTPMAGLREVG